MAKENKEKKWEWITEGGPWKCVDCPKMVDSIPDFALDNPRCTECHKKHQAAKDEKGSFQEAEEKPQQPKGTAREAIRENKEATLEVERLTRELAEVTRKLDELKLAKVTEEKEKAAQETERLTRELAEVTRKLDELTPKLVKCKLHYDVTEGEEAHQVTVDTYREVTKDGEHYMWVQENIRFRWQISGKDWETVAVDDSEFVDGVYVVPGIDFSTKERRTMTFQIIGSDEASQDPLVIPISDPDYQGCKPDFSLGLWGNFKLACKQVKEA